MRSKLKLYSVLFSALVVLPATAQQPRVLDVRKIDQPVSCTTRDGVVDEINDDALTLTEKVRGNITKTYTFVPIDLLRNGGYIQNRHNGENAYLWKDIKKGDTVTVSILRDDGDGLLYCLQVSIRRRPGGKLPPSQYPEKDGNYNAARILNEIENGNDVSDEELLKEWPPYTDSDTKKHWPGGLGNGEHRVILEANRERLAKEKKEKELKAKSADKK